MMGFTVNDQIMSDLVATTTKDQQESAQAFSLQQQKTAPSENSGTHLVRSPGLSCAVKVGEKRRRSEYCGSFSTENRSKTNDVIVNLSKCGSSRRVSNDDDGDVGEEFGRGKKLHEVDICKETLPNAMNRNGQLNKKQGAEMGAGVAVQPDSYEYADPKFNDFEKLREEANFAVGQTWALYDTTTDGMRRLYAQIRKVSAPSFGLRITYLEPDPDDEKEIQWFEEDLPVSAGQFRLGKNENTKDRSKFSHLIQCNEGSNTGHFTVSPRKGETWALFKNWDIKWSSEPDSHHKYEYEFVEILSDYSDETGVFVSYLHKAKGFASVFFQMGTGPADIFRILPHSLYQFSHSVPSFKLTGAEGKGVPKDAYELDQAALPKTIEEIMVPSNSDCNRKPKRQNIYFVSKGKVFQTGQIWSFYSGYDDLPLYCGKIQKITFTQAFKQEAVFKLHIVLCEGLIS